MSEWIEISPIWIEAWEPEGGSAGMLVELHRGEKLLIGHLNQEGSACDCNSVNQKIIRYKRVYQPGPGEGWGE